MDEREFQQLADACLAHVAQRLDHLDPDDADYATADGSVTIEFPDGVKFMLTRQSASRQVWLAADAHGYHYNYDSARAAWIDNKDGHELYARLKDLLVEHVGHPLDLEL